MKTEISKITKNNKLIIFFISIDLPIIPYLPIEGGTSDVSGIWVEANKQNTVSDNRIVTPITISSPLSGSSVNKINVVNDVTIPENQGTTSDVSGMWVEANKQNTVRGVITELWRPLPSVHHYQGVVWIRLTSEMTSPYLPIKGTTSDVSGMWVEANK